jgi:hypothetical protein
MSRSQTIVVLAGLLFAGTALGQMPPWMEGPPAGAPALANGFPNQPLLPGPAAQPPLAPVPATAPSPGSDYSMWGSLGYLLGWVRGDTPPRLLTTSPPDTPRSAAGVLGVQGNGVVFGGKPLKTGSRSGGQLQLGDWLDPEHKYGLEGGFFLLGGANTSFLAASNGTPILARPFFDATTNQPASKLVAFPGTFAGTAYISDTAHHFWGFNIDLRENVFCTPTCRLDALIGYRFLDYAEQLVIEDTAIPISGQAGPFAGGSAQHTVDRFGVRNVFNGLDIGLRNDWTWETLSFGLLGKVAGGYLDHGLRTVGFTTFTAPGMAPAAFPRGLLALPSNGGAPGSHSWTYVPEVGGTLGWQLSSNIRLNVGYWALWLMNAAQPGHEIDQAINPNNLPPATTTAPPVRPLPLVHATQTLWVQALTVGLEVRY